MTLDPSFVVFKVGGSLLDLPDLAERLRAAWALWPGHAKLTVVGGGATADVVRNWDRVFQLGEEAAHWLAIEALELNSKLLEQLVPELRLVRSLGQMRVAHASGHPALLCVKCFVKWLETQPAALPHRWDVTTDSIAAAVTRAWRADELVLLKSVEFSSEPVADTLDMLVAEGKVDAYFPQAVSGVEAITWINLRSEFLEQRSICARPRDTDHPVTRH